MTILEIYEKINLKIPLEQRRFFNYFNDSVYELNSLYSDLLFEEKVKFTPIASLSNDNVVLPLYHNAIIDNVLFLSGENEFYKNEFLRKADLAYKKYWNDKAKGKKFKRMRW